MEWLKNVLGEAYTEDIDKRISDEISKGYVSKTDFNAKNEALKNLETQLAERDKQLDGLKKSGGDNAELKKQIEALQQQNAEQAKAHEAEVAQLKMDNAVETALTASGARNNIAVKALLADFLKNAKLDENGAVKGLADELKSMSESDSTSFLFNTTGKQQFRGMQPGSVGGKIPPTNCVDVKDMNYNELCAYLDANPGAKLE